MDSKQKQQMAETAESSFSKLSGNPVPTQVTYNSRGKTTLVPDFENTNERQFLMNFKEYNATMEQLLYPPKSKG